jgi:hypothetical protein
MCIHAFGHSPLATGVHSTHATGRPHIRIRVHIHVRSSSSSISVTLIPALRLRTITTRSRRGLCHTAIAEACAAPGNGGMYVSAFMPKDDEYRLVDCYNGDS